MASLKLAGALSVCGLRKHYDGQVWRSAHLRLACSHDLGNFVLGNAVLSVDFGGQEDSGLKIGFDHGVRSLACLSICTLLVRKH